MKKLFRQNRTAAAGLGAGVLMVVGLVLTGCQTSQQRILFSPVPGEGGDGATGPSAFGEAARFAPGDDIKVTLSGIQEPPLPHQEQVKEDGTITMPEIGAIKAEGKTLGELQKDIYARYVPLYYKRLTVTVSSERRVYYVQGEVRSSGRQEYLGPTTVLKAIATAGSFADFADRAAVVLTRADGTQTIVNCSKAAKDPTYDLPVYPGDKIEVPMRGIGTIFRGN